MFDYCLDNNIINSVGNQLLRRVRTSFYYFKESFEHYFEMFSEPIDMMCDDFWDDKFEITKEEENKTKIFKLTYIKKRNN